MSFDLTRKLIFEEGELEKMRAQLSALASSALEVSEVRR